MLAMDDLGRLRSAWRGAGSLLVMAFLQLGPPRVWAGTFSVQLVKSDRPGELVHVLDPITAKWQADGNEGFPRSDHSRYDMGMRCERGFRVTTWLKHFSVDGNRIFQKRYKGKFLFRDAVARVELADGKHLLSPGEHVLVVRNGKASSSDPDVKVEGATISVTCYPVKFCGLNKSVASGEPLGERMTHLPGKVFNVQVYNKEGKPDPKKRDEPPGPTWDDLLEVHTDFKPLIVYLPANTLERAYRTMPSKDEFALAAGKVTLRGSSSLASGVYVEGATSVWIPRYTSKAIFRCKTSSPLHVQLSGTFGIDCSTQHVPSETLEQRLYYHQFWEPKIREFNAGHVGRKPLKGLDIASDLPEFPHRLLIADNQRPLSDEARLLAVALKRNVCKVGESIEARVQFRDLPKHDTFGTGDVAAFVRPISEDGSQWSAVKVEKGEQPHLYQLSFPELAGGLYTLRVVVGKPGRPSPTADIHADFELGIEQAAAKANSVAAFTHYNRESFLAGEGFELVVVVSNTTPVAGGLVIGLKAEGAEAAKEIIRKAVEQLPAGRHTFQFLVPSAATVALRPGRYEIVGALEGCNFHGRRIRVVSRKRRSAQVIAFQPSWEGSLSHNFTTEEGLDFVFDNMEQIGLNQLIEIPGGLSPPIVPLQERAVPPAQPGIPSADLFYQPSILQRVFDRTLAAQMDMWLWKPRLVGNLRWGPLEDLDVDRGVLQFQAQLIRDYPHVLGMDCGWWEAVKYVDMGSRPGSYPEQEKMREEVLLPKRFEEKYGLKYPSLAELVEYTESLNDVDNIYDRWCKRYELTCGLMPETFGAYAEAIQEVKPDLLTTWTEQEVMVAAPEAAFIPEVAYEGFPMSRWQSTHENGSRPLNTVLMTALGKYDDITRVCTVYSMQHFHIPRMRRTHFRMWQRMLMALACGADEIGYHWTDVYYPLRRPDVITHHGFATKSHVLERVAISSLNQICEMYGAVFEQARRERDLAILHSMTQLGFEHIYYGAEWHNNDQLCRYIDTPFCRGAHLLRVHSALSGSLWSHLPADIIGERAITKGRLSQYKGLVLTGIELPRLPDDVTQGIQQFIKNGGVVLMDRHCKPEIPGAVKLDFGFDFVRAGWSNWNEYRGMQYEYGRVKERLDKVLDAKFRKEIDCDSPTVLLSSVKWGESRFLTAACDRILKDTTFQGAYAREPLLTTISIQGRQPVVYDLLELKKLGTKANGGANTFVADLTRVGARVFAILPTDIAKPNVQVSSSAKAGQAISVVVGIKGADGKAVEILTPVEITIFEPSGDVRYRTYRAVKGAEPFQERFKIAENDPAGDWRVVVRELFAGRASQATFSVEAGEPQPVPSVEMPDVVVYKAERVREFLANVKEVIVPYDTDLEARDVRRQLASAKRLQQQLESLGIKAALKPVSSFAIARRNLPRGESNRSEKRVGPKYTFKGHVAIPDIAGNSSLLSSLIEVGMVPVRVTKSFPGRGRGIVMHVVSPFYYGYDAVIVSGGDEAGSAKALAALAKPGSLRDAGATSESSIAVSPAPLKPAGDFNASDVQTFPRGIVQGLNGLPVMHITPSADGGRVLVGTENFMKNMFLLDGNGKVLWSGKGAKKWPAQCRLMAGDQALVVDASGGLYHLGKDGRTVGRAAGTHSAAASADGSVILAATRDWTGAFNPDGTMLWLNDYFPGRKTRGQMRGGYPSDDFVAISPNGRLGLIFTLGSVGEGKERQFFRKMRSVDMRSGKVLANYEFAPHQSMSDVGPRLPNLNIQFCQNGAYFAATNMTGSLFVFSSHQLRLQGSHFESGPILTAPAERMGLSRDQAPTAWRTRIVAQFVDLKPDGSRLLAGFSNQKVLILDRNAQVQQTFEFDSTVVCGTFLRNGFVVYTGEVLRRYGDDGKPLWQLRLPCVYTIASSPDGSSALCGTSGGYVYRISADGKILWRTDLHPQCLGDVDELFGRLASAKEIPCGPKLRFTTPLAALEANASLGRNRLSPATANPVLDKERTIEQKVTGPLAPFATYCLVARWHPSHPNDALHLTGIVSDSEGEALVTEQESVAIDPDAIEAVLPIKTGPKPTSITVRLVARTRGQVKLSRLGLHRAEFGSENVALVPKAYQGYTRESRAQAREKLTIMFRWLAGNFEEFVQPVPLEMIDGRITRKGGSRWTAGDVGQMGGIEITFREPRTIGTIAFYDDPAHPRSYLKQYAIEYWVSKEEPADGKEKKEEEEEAAEKADEIDFVDHWKGVWKTALVERDARGCMHVHRLAKPVTSRRFRVSGVINQGLPRRRSETRMTEFELYEARWPTEGGSVRRTHHHANGRIDGELSVTDTLCRGGRRFGQATPTFAGGTLYVGVGSKLHAVSLEDLRTKWTYSTKVLRAIQSSPTVAGDLVIFGCHDQELRAVDRATGEVVWSFPTDYKITGAPCVVDGKVVWGSNDGFVYAADLKTGELQWDFEAGQPVRSSVASDGEALYFGAFNHNVYALDVETGAQKWAYKTGGAIRSGVAVTEDAAYVGSDDAHVHAIAKSTGKRLWTHKTGNYVEASPAVDERAVYVGSVDGVFRAIDRQTGKKLWQYEVGAAIRSAALVLGPHVFFHADNAMLYRLDRQSGENLGEVKLPQRGLTAITPVGSTLVIGARYGCFLVTGK